MTQTTHIKLIAWDPLADTCALAAMGPNPGYFVQESLGDIRPASAEEAAKYSDKYGAAPSLETPQPNAGSTSRCLNARASERPSYEARASTPKARQHDF